MAFAKNNFKKIASVIFAVAFFVLPHGAHAAMLSIVPETGTYSVGQTFTATVSVSSYSQPMNATSGTLVFPSDSLSVVSISTNGSIITNWLPPGTTKPTYTAGTDSIHFEGVALGGYNGAPTAVFTVYFKVLKTGTAALSFQKASILANDGKGTDIALAFGKASYKLSAAPTPAAGQTSPTQTPPVEQPAGATAPAPTEGITIPAPVTTTASVPATPSIPLAYAIWALAILSLLLIVILILIWRVMTLTQLVRHLQEQEKRLENELAEKEGPAVRKRKRAPIEKSPHTLVLTEPQAEA